MKTRLRFCTRHLFQPRFPSALLCVLVPAILMSDQLFLPASPDLTKQSRPYTYVPPYTPAPVFLSTLRRAKRPGSRTTSHSQTLPGSRARNEERRTPALESHSERGRVLFRSHLLLRAPPPSQPSPAEAKGRRVAFWHARGVRRVPADLFWAADALLSRRAPNPGMRES